MSSPQPSSPAGTVGPHVYGWASDIWAVGVTVLEMATGRQLFTAGWPAVLRLCMEHRSPELPESLSEPARDFIARCLAISPSERPTAEELLSHRFLLAVDALDARGGGGGGSDDSVSLGDTSFTTGPASLLSSPLLSPGAATASPRPRSPARLPPMASGGSGALAAAAIAAAMSGGSGSSPGSSASGGSSVSPLKRGGLPPALTDRPPSGGSDALATWSVSTMGGGSTLRPVSASTTTPRAPLPPLHGAGSAGSGSASGGGRPRTAGGGSTAPDSARSDLSDDTDGDLTFQTATWQREHLARLREDAAKAASYAARSSSS